MYLNEKKVNRIILFSKIRIVVYFIFDLIFILSIEKPAIEGSFMTTISIIIFLSFFIYRNIMKIKLMRSALTYNSIFALDFDGYVSIEELALKTDTNEKKVSKEIKKLIQKGIFQNISLEFGEKPQVVLKGKVKESENITETVECPYCGATALKRKGFACKCEFCGNNIM